METKTAYKIGDWVMDKQYGDIYEIVKVWPDIFSDWTQLVKKIDGRTNTIYLPHYATTCNFASLNSNFDKVPAARLLYGNKE